jgi:hypothetical protein
MQKEDFSTKRICVSKSINGCLTAIEPCEGDLLYIHWCESNNVTQPSINQVADAPFTGEEWILEPVVMNAFMTIRIIKRYSNMINNLSNNLYTYELIEG